MPEAKPKTAVPKRLSPGRRQYLEFKEKYQDCLLLFRMGDFYETFDEDAKTMARVLDIALTSRDVGGGLKSPLAGIPHHALGSYLGKLVDAGLKVAVAEQTSDPAQSRGIVDRAVVRVITPGTVSEPSLLAHDRNNYLAAAISDGEQAGLAYIDVSTSEFVTAQFPVSGLRAELDRLAPSELLADRAVRSELGTDGDGALGPNGAGGSGASMVVRELDETRLDDELAARKLRDHFGVATLEAFGCDGKPLAIAAAAAVIDFLSETHLGALPQVTSLRTQQPDGFMQLDRRALRDLEVFESTTRSPDASTLYRVVNGTVTSLGARLLRRWLARPLLDLPELQTRQDAVAEFTADSVRRATLRELLRAVPDIERLINRVRTYAATPRDLAALSRGLRQIPGILDTTGSSSNGLRNTPVAGLRPCDAVTTLLDAAIAEDPPAVVGEGGAIRSGFDPELDETRGLASDARSAIAAIESSARESTGIKSLKVGYNRVFGYYIEVSRSNLDKVPDYFERRQTLTGGERYITPELKELESRVLNARDRINELERATFRRVCGEVAQSGERVMAAARAIAWLDTVSSLADVAAKHGWVRPVLNEGDAVLIKDGRHPVVEAALGPGRFVPNDVSLSNTGEQLIVITGPNMSGKSTYIRQVAVLVLLAQIGSFIPAAEAEIGLVDRIFTRAGLTDNISGGQSTFMVEMIETASILRQATPRSLAVLDEIGRGTSTYDGMAIARAVAEHLHNDPDLGCKTLFATHYHEMTALADALPRAANYRVAVSEDGHDVVFLHRIVPGGADRSYGVHVARLAGMPPSVVARAWTLLEELESSGPAGLRSRDSAAQLPLFTEGSKLAEDLKNLEIEGMTPLEAINALYRLQQEARK